MPDWVLTSRQVIGGRVRAARLHANLTQLGLGEAVGVDHKTVHRIEYGTTDPQLSVLLLIAHALDVPLADLVRQ
jgi:transcriptional regulator with XRE-family HTH domain